MIKYSFVNSEPRLLKLFVSDRFSDSGMLKAISICIALDQPESVSLKIVCFIEGGKIPTKN